MKSLRLALGFAALLACFAAGANAQAQDFYKGKTITILVGYPPGGGFDAYARLLAHYLGRHIPGNPDVIVSNMPGAVSLTSVNYLDTTAPKDGTVLDAFDPSNIGASALGVALLKVDFRKYNWLGSISRGTTGCFVWHKLGIRNLADAKAHGPLHFGRSSAGSPNDMDQKILKKIFGVDVVQVSGYGGSTEEILAVERGETDGLCGAWTSLPADWIAKHEIIPIIRSGPVVSPDLPPDVPYIVDIAPTERDRQIIRILMASEEVSRPIVASAAVPADRMAILRAGFDATMTDPDFLADAAKQRLPIAPENATEAAKTVDAIYATPEDIKAAARQIAGE
jgi:tripartite-type tricarboxylate transporter receptor subunit TctC